MLGRASTTTNGYSILVMSCDWRRATAFTSSWTHIRMSGRGLPEDQERQCGRSMLAGSTQRNSHPLRPLGCKTPFRIQLTIPKMIWATNYTRLACQVIFTCFFGGRDFAPKAIIDGKNIQDYLQDHFVGACGYLARKIQEAGNLENDVVIGWESMNEPNRGLIGWQDITVVPSEQKLQKRPFTNSMASDTDWIRKTYRGGRLRLRGNGTIQVGHRACGSERRLSLAASGLRRHQIWLDKGSRMEARRVFVGATWSLGSIEGRGAKERLFRTRSENEQEDRL